LRHGWRTLVQRLSVYMRWQRGAAATVNAASMSHPNDTDFPVCRRVGPPVTGRLSAISLSREDAAA
jgi:hypothetical protein